MQGKTTTTKKNNTLYLLFTTYLKILKTLNYHFNRTFSPSVIDINKEIT